MIMLEGSFASLAARENEAGKVLWRKASQHAAHSSVPAKKTSEEVKDAAPHWLECRLLIIGSKTPKTQEMRS